MKQSLKELLFSAVAFIFSYSIVYLTGIELVKNAVLLAFIIQWILFIPAYLFQTEKFFDISGSITYISVVSYCFLNNYDPKNLDIGNLILSIIVITRALRLGSFLFMRIHKDGEDKRFRTIKPSATQFFMTWTLQGLWVSLCSMCALTAISSSTGVIVNTLFYIGFALFMLGFCIEVISDNQKSKFRSFPENRDKFITTGLWAKSRHPNFFGEIVLWTGVAVMSFSSLEGPQYLTLISPLFTYILLMYVSGVRMLEARADKKWGHDEAYIKYKSDTPVLILRL